MGAFEVDGHVDSNPIASNGEILDAELIDCSSRSLGKFASRIRLEICRSAIITHSVDPGVLEQAWQKFRMRGSSSSSRQPVSGGSNQGKELSLLPD